MSRLFPVAFFLLGGCAQEKSGPETWSVVAELKEASDFPTVKEIRPYRDALIAHHYRIVSWEGDLEPPDPAPGEVAIYHWAIVDGKPTNASELKVGDVVELEIQRMSDRTDLKGRRRVSSLDAFDLQEYLASKPDGPAN